MELFGYKIFKKNHLDTVFFNREKVFDFLLSSISAPIVFDVGANKGQSIKLFKQKMPNCVIHSFEPNSECYDELSKVGSMFDNVILNRAGLGSKNEKLLLNKYEESSINSFLKIEETSFAVKICSHKKINESVVDKHSKIEECNVLTLDSYCKDSGIDHINLLKIDTQGFENEVLGGARTMLESGKIDVILTEITFDDVYGSGNTFLQLESLVVPFGYKLYDICHIYKDLKIGRTCWVDAVYVRIDYMNELLGGIVK